jgi:hypothetical protein
LTWYYHTENRIDSTFKNLELQNNDLPASAFFSAALAILVVVVVVGWFPVVVFVFVLSTAAVVPSCNGGRGSGGNGWREKDHEYKNNMVQK